MAKSAPQTAALEIASQRYPDARVVFLAGSVIRGESTSSSDLDLVVVYDFVPQAYRESFLHEQWPVEAFVHDPQTLNYFFFEVDRPTGVPALANMMAEGIELPTPSEFSTSLKELATSAINMGPPPWNEQDLAMSRYSITELVDDMQSPRSRDELAACAVRLYELIAIHFFRSRRLWAAEGKSIPRRLSASSPEFAARFCAAFRSLFEDGDTKGVFSVCEEVLLPSGGRLFAGHKLFAPESWRLSLDNAR